ncbi:MAG TPA: hypothetical protein VFN30_04425 [Chitinophagaceae bacterium]|nr:hypothetical protein [Chitinophagaceae bacterium]
MKLFLVPLFLLFFSPLFSQRYIDGFADARNVIKINLSSLTTSTFSFQYERALTSRVSLLLGVKFRPAAAIPFKSIIKHFLDTTSAKSFTDFVNNAKIESFAVTPEIRFYYGRGPSSGFYLAPFARFESNYLRPWQYTFVSLGKPVLVDFTARQTGIGGGLQLGALFVLSDKISLDLWLAGPYVFANKITVASKTDLSNNTEQELSDIRKDIETFSNDYLPGHTAKVTVTSNGAFVVAKGAALGIRTLGVAIGLRF